MPEWFWWLAAVFAGPSFLAGRSQLAMKPRSAVQQKNDLRVIGILVVLAILTFWTGKAISKSFGKEPRVKQANSRVVKDFEIPPNLGRPNAQGYYRLPDPRGSLYIIDHSRTPPSQRCASKTVIGVAYTLAAKWRAKYPDSRLEIWDLNAPDHLSHNRGIDIDITTTNRSGGNTAGSNARSIQLGKWAVDTGKVSVIYYNDPVVQRAVNTYAGRVVMSYWHNHEDHFHIRVHPQYAGGTSYFC